MYDAEDLRRRAEALLASDLVTEPTRQVLQARLARLPGPPQCLSDDQLERLRAVAARLIPLEGLEATLDLAGRFDAALASQPGDGWRYADLPPDTIAQPQGLDALEASAIAVRGRSFTALDGPAQDAILSDVQAGRPAGPPWPFAAERWFEDLLAGLVRLAYAHPTVQVAIGYEGFADAHGMAPRA